MSVDDAVTLARAELPDTTLRSVFLPTRADQPLRINFMRKRGAPVSTAYVDPWTHRIVEIFDTRTYSAGELFMAWQRPLHGGNGLGWPYRILVFLSGFLPVLFSITGITMWLLKRRARGMAPDASQRPVSNPAE